MADVLRSKKAHFIGIGGVGMSATAKLLKDAGVVVSGSDEAVYDPIASFLTREGLMYKTPYKAENIPPDADLIVVGSSRATMNPKNNPEVEAALLSGKTLVSYPDVLQILSKDKETLIVAGSYGKTTSTALLAHCLIVAGKDPSYWIPAVSLTPAVNAKIGTSNLFVLEGDEYPTSNSDDRSKFLHYNPTHVLITPLAHDHLNVFPTPESYIEPFFELVKMATGTVVVCTESSMSKEFVTTCGKPVITYGVHEGDYHASNIVWGKKTTFEIGDLAIETILLGEHNIQNIVGVVALLLTRNLATPAQISEGVRTFKGVTRRLDLKSEKTSIPIYEGFGSSYEKLHAAIAAMKLHFPQRRLVVVFEPHTFSWRNRESLPWYDTAFKGVSEVYIFEPPQDGKDNQLSLSEMVERVQKSGVTSFGAHTGEELLETLSVSLQASDVVLLSSSGAMGGLVASLPALAEKKFPA